MGEAELGEGLPYAKIRVVAELVSQAYDSLGRQRSAIELGIQERRIGLRIIAKMNALGSGAVPAAHEVAVHAFGQKWNERGHEFRQLDEHVVQRLIGGQLVLVSGVARSPESPAIAADVP